MLLLWFPFLRECRLLILAILHIVYDRTASSTSMYIIYMEVVDGIPVIDNV